jgi:hypothetical protein
MISGIRWYFMREHPGRRYAVYTGKCRYKGKNNVLLTRDSLALHKWSSQQFFSDSTWDESVHMVVFWLFLRRLADS